MTLARPPKEERDAMAAKLEEVFGAPKCPAGCGDVRRPKCMWERDDCPRHDIADAWTDLLYAACAYATAATPDDS